MMVMLIVVVVCCWQAAAEESKEEEQTKFKVKLVSFSGDSKVKLIKEVKVVMEGMNLVQVSRNH